MSTIAASNAVQRGLQKFNGLYACDVHVSAFVRLQVGEDLKEGAHLTSQAVDNIPMFCAISGCMMYSGLERGQLVPKTGGLARADVDKVGRPTPMAELQL